MINILNSGSFDKTESFLKKMLHGDHLVDLDIYGQRGVDALSLATPVDTGLASNSWYYETSNSNGIYSITWGNDDVENGAHVAILLQYDHGTGTGGFVRGIDYINPAIRPIFDQIAIDVWERVSNA